MNLRASTTALLEEYNKLESKYGDLEEESSQLKTINKELFTNVSVLKEWPMANTTKYKEIIKELNTSINNYRKYVDEVDTYTSLTTVNQTLRSEFINKALISANLCLKNFNASSKRVIIKLFEWVLINTYYQNDPYVPTYEWGPYDNVWKLPNETVTQEGGDCEDLALLIYAVLKNYGIRAWLIFWWNGSEGGHAAAIAHYNDGWYLIDPVMNWLNGYSYYLKMHLLNEEGKEVTALTQPLQLRPSLKRWLINEGLAKPIWINLSSGAEVQEIEVNGKSELSNLLEEWLSDWGKEFTGYSLMNAGEYEEFSNLSQLINYLQGE